MSTTAILSLTESNPVSPISPSLRKQEHQTHSVYAAKKRLFSQSSDLGSTCVDLGVEVELKVNVKEKEMEMSCDGWKVVRMKIEIWEI
ncbi:MAG: hypothetical protein EZS28_042656, partial [Streblomastix strix]